MSFNEANILRSKGRFDGVRHSEPIANALSLPDQPQNDVWREHSAATETASAKAGIASGEEFQYRSTALMINPDGDPEATINLIDHTSDRLVQLRHNYTTNVSSFADRLGQVNTFDYDEVGRVVADVAPEWKDNATGMFIRMREHAVKEPGIELRTRNALFSVPEPWRQHGEAAEAASEAAGLHQGESHEYLSTALMIDPYGEPEAIINLRAEDGGLEQISHNYSTGKTRHLGARRVEIGDPERMREALADLGGDDGNGNGVFFEKLRVASLAQPKLHNKLRNALKR